MSHTLKSPAEIPAIVEAFLGFKPSASLVIMGLGGGPSARVDISEPTVIDALVALRSAERHWGNGVIVALYSDDVDLIDVESGLMSVMPGLKVKVMVDVTDSFVVDMDGNTFTATPTDNPEIAARRVVESRESIIAEAERCGDARVALTVALEAYRAGNGARAWIYLDRFHALGGQSFKAHFLATFLTEAIDPKSDAALQVLGD